MFVCTRVYAWIFLDARRVRLQVWLAEATINGSELPVAIRVRVLLLLLCACTPSASPLCRCVAADTVVAWARDGHGWRRTRTQGRQLGVR